MSLIQCPECKNNVSDKAKSCPMCGNPIQKSMNNYFVFKSLFKFFGILTFFSVFFLLISLGWLHECGEEFEVERAKVTTTKYVDQELESYHYGDINYDLIENGQTFCIVKNITIVTSILFFVLFIISAYLKDKKKENSIKVFGN